MDRRKFLKACGAMMVLPALSKLDSVAQCFVDSGVERVSVVRDITFEEFQQHLLKEIAKAMHVPYRLISEDYRNITYGKAER